MGRLLRISIIIYKFAILSDILKKVRIRTSYIVLLLLCCLVFPARGAVRTVDLRGVVRDTVSNETVIGAVVEIIDSVDVSAGYGQTDNNGEFVVTDVDVNGKRLRISILGFKTKIIGDIPDSGDFGDIFITPDNIVLESAVLSDQAIRSSQSGDTLSYNAAAYKTMLGADSETLIAKMPGISVSDDGVDANGKDVRKVMIDGQEFFGNDVLTALKNIPADMIQQIEVINKLSDNAQQTGVDDGEGYTAINIVTKPEARNGSLAGRVYAGYGIPDKYMAGGNLNWFGKDKTATLIGMGNNLSKYNFTSSDLVGASASADNSPVQGDFKVKPLPGISSVASTGVNFNNKWFNGSYFFNRIKNRNHYTEDKYTVLDEETSQKTKRDRLQCIELQPSLFCQDYGFSR